MKDDVLRTTEELLWHPVAEDILARMDADEKAGGGDGVGGITTEFYRRLVVDKGGKDLLTNVRLRKKLVEACGKDESVRKAVWTMCRRDLLFWVNMFAFTYDPRNLGNPAATGLRKMPKVVPFVTWEFQDDETTGDDTNFSLNTETSSESQSDAELNRDLLIQMENADDSEVSLTEEPSAREEADPVLEDRFHQFSPAAMDVSGDQQGEVPHEERGWRRDDRRRKHDGGRRAGREAEERVA